MNAFFVPVSLAKSCTGGLSLFLQVRDLLLAQRSQRLRRARGQSTRLGFRPFFRIHEYLYLQNSIHFVMYNLFF